MTKKSEDEKKQEEKIKKDEACEEKESQKEPTDGCKNENCCDSENSVNPTSEKSDSSVEVGLNEALNKKLDELNEKYLRLYADFDNYKKRAVKEKIDASAYAIGGVMTKLLNVLDNFNRALDAKCEDQSFYDGVKMVAKQLDDILTAEGLTPIEAVGKTFDPNYHNAVMTDNDDNYDEDIITAELQKGYVYKEKVIRPSMVKVNKK